MGVCSGGDGGAAEEMRRLEEERQGRIALGKAQVNRIFDGGWAGSGKAGSYAPGTTYYTSLGQQVTPQTMGEGFTKWMIEKGYGQTPVNQAGQPVTGNRMNVRGGVRPPPTPTVQTNPNLWPQFMQEMAQQGNLYTGRQKSEGYNDDYYDKIRNAYVGYATPIATTQSEDMRSRGLYSLANRGLLDSTGHNKMFDAFRDTNAQVSQNIANEAENLVTQRRGDVENQRNTIMSQLISSGDPNLAAQQAVAASQQFSAMPAWQPLGQLFGDWANLWLANQTAKAYGQMAPQGGVRYNWATMPISKEN